MDAYLLSSKDSVDDILEEWSTERPELDTTTLGIFGRLSSILTKLRTYQNELYEQYGLTLASFDVLANLRRSGAPHRKTAGQLAESSMLTSGGVTFRLDSMEKLGLIERVRTPDDRRVVYAQLTPKGKEVIDEAFVKHLEGQRQVLAQLSSEEIDQLAMLLKKTGLSLDAYTSNQVAVK